MKAAIPIPRFVVLVRWRLYLPKAGWEPTRRCGCSTPGMKRFGLRRLRSPKTRFCRTGFPKKRASYGSALARFGDIVLRSSIVDAGSGKTRVELELRTNLRGIEKDAWRNGDRYLGLLAQKLQRGGGK